MFFIFLQSDKMNGTEVSFREKNDQAKRRILSIPGAKLIQGDLIAATLGETPRTDFDRNLLVIGNRVEREWNGKKFVDLNVQVEFDSARASSLLSFIAEVKSNNPRGLITQKIIRRVLGGSDVEGLRTELDGRAARKVMDTERKWSMDWVALVPRRGIGVSAVLSELAAFDLTNREVFNVEHREHNGGAMFPYMLKPEYKKEEELTQEEKERWLHPTDGAPELPWTDEYCKWVDAVWQVLVNFGVPGVREMMQEQMLYYKKKFSTFSFETLGKFRKEWYEQNKNTAIGKKGDMYNNWLIMPHCAIQALQQSIAYQKTTTAKEYIEALIQELIKSDSFLKKEKIPFKTIGKWFEKAGVPYVLETKIYRKDQKKWKSDKLPYRKWKENSTDPKCVHLKVGMWNEEHYFLWREDINSESGLKKEEEKWPKKYIKLIGKPYKKDPSKYYAPAMSSGLFLMKLVEKELLVPINGIYKEKSRIFIEEVSKDLYEQLCDLDQNVYQNCVPDKRKKLDYKLGLDKIPRECLFSGDTESFINPVNGVHDPCLLVIKGIYRDDIKISVGKWEKYNPILEGMKQFMAEFTKKRRQELYDKLMEHEGENQDIDHFLKKLQGKCCLKKLQKCLHLEGVKDFVNKKDLTPIIYFHNLGYDVQAFITTFDPAKRECAIKKGAVWYSARFKLFGAEFELRNSFTIITTALKNFPKMFLPKEEQEKMKKEVYAYDAINENLMMVRESSFENRFVVSLQNMEEAIQLYEYHKNNEEKVKLLEDLWKSASEVDCLEGEFGEFFDVGKYSKYYCERDVDLLAIGMKSWAAIGEQDATKNTFKGMPPFEKFDVFNFLSAPAIAQAVTESQIRVGLEDVNCDENKCTYKYKGKLRKFMLNCTSGGRCTLANEKRQLVDCCKEDPRVAELIEKSKDPDRGLSEEDEKFLYHHLIQDFDARSLYPTAMSRSFVPLGRPVYCNFGRDSKKDEKWAMERKVDDAMYVITDIRYDVPLAMPTNCWKQEKPEPRCRWNNDVPEGVMQLRKLTDLRTMVKIQGAHFRVLGGLEWKNGKCEKIQQFMKDVYAFRRLNHSGGFDHPIQEAAKLIMNSFYGKNVTKMREGEEWFFPSTIWEFNKFSGKATQKSGAPALIDFVKRNWRRVSRVQYLGGCFSVKVHSEDDAAYDVCFGCEVLAGSRAVICPVSAMVEQITGEPCLYTDTDSLHLYGWQVDAIADAFKEYFGMEMIGGELGQFHVDFEPRTFRKGEKCLGSSFFCGVGKKMYIDELRGSEGSCEFHRRAKGIRAEYLSKEEYIRLYYGETLYKDLDKCGMVQIRQKEGHNMSVHMVKQVRATAEGEIEVITDLVESKDGERLIEDLDLDGLLSAADELEQERVVTDEEDLEKQQAEKRKRDEQVQQAIEGNEDDTIEIIYDPESDEEQDEPLEKKTRIEILQ